MAEKTKKSSTEEKVEKTAKPKKVAEKTEKAKETTKTTKATTKKTDSVETETQKKQSEQRVARGTNRPIEYYFIVGHSKINTIEYIEVQQVLNDKFSGRLTQPQYFPVAEQTKRIFTLNNMLFDKAQDESIMNEKIKFLVQVSAKWFESEKTLDEIMKQISSFGENVILCFDSVTLVRAGDVAKEALKKISKDYRLKILFDNVEFQNLSLIIGYHPDYVRLDARFIDIKDEHYTDVLKFMREYLKVQKIKMAVRNVKDEAQKNYFLNLGADVVEGNGVYTPKKLIASILKDYKL